MILAITEQFHDHEPSQYFVDTNKLSIGNYVEALILKESKKKSKALNLRIEATEWESNPKFSGNSPGVSKKAKVKRPDAIDKSLFLTIYFDC